MKRAVITVIIVLTVIAAADRGRSFPRMTEITLAEPVFVIGIDKYNDKTKLSLIYEKIEESDEGGGDINQKYIRSAVDSTAASAVETLKKNLPRETAISTADYFLIGEEAARENLMKYTDFLLRNNTLRLTASIFIVRGEAAETAEILIETRTLDILQNFGEYSGINAVSSEMKFFELLSEAAAHNSHTVPALVIKEHEGGKIAVPSGYAIIKDGVLEGFLDQGAARGYNLIKNKSVYSTIEIMDLAVRLENASRKISFDWDGNNLTGINLDINIFTSVIDGAGIKPDITLIEKEQKRVIFGEVLCAVNASKRYGCDFIGFGEVLRMRHPLRWERIREHWRQIYINTPVKINVNSEIS
jgi:spore germination protein KC